MLYCSASHPLHAPYAYQLLGACALCMLANLAHASCITYTKCANLTAVFHALQYRAERGHVGVSTDG